MLFHDGYGDWVSRAFRRVTLIEIRRRYPEEQKFLREQMNKPENGYARARLSDMHAEAYSS